MNTSNFTYFVILMLFFSNSAMGTEIYSYTDKNGVTHYSDQKPLTSHRITVKVFPKETTFIAEQTSNIYDCSNGKNLCLTDKKPHNQAKKVGDLLGSKGVYSIAKKTEETSNIPPPKTTTINIYKCITRNGKIYTDMPDTYTNCKVIHQKQGTTIIPSYSIPISSGYKTASVHRKYEKYKNLVEEVAIATNLEPALLHAVIHTESAYNPNAVSPKGATGLMQLISATAKRFGVSDRTDATDNVYGGAKYLSYLLKLFDQNVKLALAGYNAGENAVIRYGYKIPPYRETKNYVKRVLKLYHAYKNY